MMVLIIKLISAAHEQTVSALRRVEKTIEWILVKLK